MSTAISKAELDQLSAATYSRQPLTPEQSAALKAVVARAVADDGPSVEELPKHWREYAAQLATEKYAPGCSTSWMAHCDTTMRVLDGCASDLEKAIVRGLKCE